MAGHPGAWGARSDGDRTRAKRSVGCDLRYRHQELDNKSLADIPWPLSVIRVRFNVHYEAYSPPLPAQRSGPSRRHGFSSFE